MKHTNEYLLKTFVRSHWTQKAFKRKTSVCKKLDSVEQIVIKTKFIPKTHPQDIPPETRCCIMQLLKILSCETFSSNDFLDYNLPFFKTSQPEIVNFEMFLWRITDRICFHNQEKLRFLYAYELTLFANIYTFFTHLQTNTNTYKNKNADKSR